MPYILTITGPDGSVIHVEPTRYNFRAQAEAHGKEWERKVPGARWQVQEQQAQPLDKPGEMGV